MLERNLDILFSKGWTCDRWSVGSGRVAAAAWAPDSLQLVFATTEEPVLYCLSFQVQICSLRDRYNVPILKGWSRSGSSSDGLDHDYLAFQVKFQKDIF